MIQYHFGVCYVSSSVTVFFFFRDARRSMKSIIYFSLQVSVAKTVVGTFASLPFLVFLKNSRDKTGRGLLSSLPYLLWQQWQEKVWQRQQQENGVPLPSVAALPLPSLGCAPACYTGPGFLANRQVFFSCLPPTISTLYCWPTKSAPLLFQRACSHSTYTILD